MAYLYGLVLASALFLLSTPANAQSIPATATTAPTVGKWAAGTGSTTKVFSTAVQACQDNGVRGYGWTYGLINTVARAGVSPAVHDCNWTAPPAPYQGYWSSTGVVQTCVASGGFLTDPCPVTYTCPSGYTLNGTMCDPPAVNLCSDLTGQYAGRYDIEGSTSGLKQVCETSLNSGDSSAPGCLLTGTPSTCVQFSPTGPYYCEVRMSATGAKCAPSATGSHDVGGSAPAPAPGDDALPSTCPPGKVSGTVNGTTVCVDPGTSDPIKTNSGTTNTKTEADGTTVQTTQSRTTDCTATACTTTTTTTTVTTPPGGTPTTATTSETGTCSRSSPTCSEDGDDEPSSFGGTCGVAFACDGDAIMCAVALEQHKRNCSLFVDASPESTLYETEKGKTGPQYLNQNVPLSPSSFSQANALGASAQCIQDKVITVAGSTITLPFSQICSTLQHLGTVLLFIAFLTAYRIVSRG